MYIQCTVNMSSLYTTVFITGQLGKIWCYLYLSNNIFIAPDFRAIL